MQKRPYQELIDLVKEHGGSMTFERQGAPGGIWTIRLMGRVREFESSGSGFPELDQLYRMRPDPPTPSHFQAFTNTLKSDAWERLQRLLSVK